MAAVAAAAIDASYIVISRCGKFHHNWTSGDPSVLCLNSIRSKQHHSVLLSLLTCISPGFHSPCRILSVHATAEEASREAEPTSAQLIVWEAASEGASSAALAGLNTLETCQMTASRTAGTAYVAARPSCAQSLASLAVQFGGGDHAVHDALAIMDRCVAAGLSFCMVSQSCLLYRMNPYAAGAPISKAFLMDVEPPPIRKSIYMLAWMGCLPLQPLMHARNLCRCITNRQGLRTDKPYFASEE